MTKQDSGQSAHHRSYSMVHLHSKSLASPGRCMCEKKVVRKKPVHPVLIVVMEHRQLSRFSADLLT